MTDRAYGRNYQEDGSSRALGTAIHITGSKLSHDSNGKSHPDDPLNQKYLDAGAGDDHERPLCVAIHDGEICKRPSRRGARYCYVGRGDD